MSKYILPTYTGKLFDLESPKPEMICIEDIAHHLSIENRYNGSTKFSYSVAQHSVLVAMHASNEFKLEALLHDAEEAYYKDLPSPWKKILKQNFNTNIWDTTVYTTKGYINNIFKLESYDEVTELIKGIDLRMASTEIYQLFDDYHPSFWQHDHIRYPAYDDTYIFEISAKTAEESFLMLFNNLKRN
jgi:5'-deoxynucleotidase YfbR-like HD superfamily hydrolase